MWLLVVLADALLFAVVAVLVRRRWDAEELMVATLAGALLLAGSIPFIPPFATEFRDVLRLPMTAIVAGVVVSAFMVNRMIARNPEPDLVPEVLVGVLSFAGGFFAMFLLSWMTVLRIA